MSSTEKNDKIWEDIWNIDVSIFHWLLITKNEKYDKIVEIAISVFLLFPLCLLVLNIKDIRHIEEYLKIVEMLIVLTHS